MNAATNGANDTTNVEPMAGSNILLMGPAGTGKTYSIGTAVDTGMQVFYIALESGIESLLGYWLDKGLPIPDNLHYHVVKAPKLNFKALQKIVKAVNNSTLEMLAKMGDPNRTQYNQFEELYSVLINFRDQRDGKEYGCVQDFPPGAMLVIDSLTPLSSIAMNTQVGGRPAISLADYLVAQRILKQFLDMLTRNCPCFFVLLAHIERETDQIAGGTKITVSTIGQKLAPTLTPDFSDVILSRRSGSKWNWDTSDPQADLKTRNLSLSAKLEPSFKPIIERWVSRGGVIATEMVPVTAQ